MTYNIHLLLHTADCVQNLGPLHVHDAFAYENQNRLLLKLKSSPTHIPVQLAKRFMFFKSIPSFSTLFPVGNRVLDFVQDFEQKIKSCVLISRTVLIGRKENFFNEQESQLGFEGSCVSFDRMHIKHKRYTTETYANSLKTNDSAVTFLDGSKGVITKICSVDSEESNSSVIIFYHSIRSNQRCLFGKFKEIRNIQECTIQRNNLGFCTPEDIRNHCFIRSIADKMYVSEVFTGCTGD